jgi:hypothetical protein
MRRPLLLARQPLQWPDKPSTAISILTELTECAHRITECACRQTRPNYCPNFRPNFRPLQKPRSLDPPQFPPFTETPVTGLTIAPVLVKLATTITATILVSDAPAIAAINPLRYATALTTTALASYATTSVAIILARYMTISIARIATDT